MKQKLVSAAEKSFNWYEEIVPKFELEPLPLVFDYMTRTGRVDEDRLDRDFPHFMNRYRREWREFNAA